MVQSWEVKVRSSKGARGRQRALTGLMQCRRRKMLRMVVIDDVLPQRSTRGRCFQNEKTQNLPRKKGRVDSEQLLCFIPTLMPNIQPSQPRGWF